MSIPCLLDPLMMALKQPSQENLVKWREIHCVFQQNINYLAVMWTKLIKSSEKPKSSL